MSMPETVDDARWPFSVGFVGDGTNNAHSPGESYECCDEPNEEGGQGKRLFV